MPFSKIGGDKIRGFENGGNSARLEDAPAAQSGYPLDRRRRLGVSPLSRIVSQARQRHSYPRNRAAKDNWQCHGLQYLDDDPGFLRFVQVCPLWVISGHTDKSAPCRLYPHYRKLGGASKFGFWLSVYEYTPLCVFSVRVFLG